MTPSARAAEARGYAMSPDMLPPGVPSPIAVGISRASRLARIDHNRS
jgi:hypothetical protein